MSDERILRVPFYVFFVLFSVLRAFGWEIKKSELGVSYDVVEGETLNTGILNALRSLLHIPGYHCVTLM